MEWLSELSGLWATLGLILGFGFIIFVHELGHFMAAKSVGIKVEKFAVGFDFFGLKIASFKRGETEYLIGLIPLGGYVKMLGQEDMDPNAMSDDPRAYNNKPAWAKLLVLSAGVIMNAIFAIIFFIVAFMAGVNFPPAIAGLPIPGTPAATTPADEDANVIGIKPGDKIISIDGEEVSEFMDVKLASALAAEKDKLKYLIEREENGETKRYTFQLEPKVLPGQKLLSVGLSVPASLKTPDADLISKTRKTAMEEVGLQPGSTLVKVNDKAVTGFHEFYEAIQRSNGEPMVLGFKNATDEAYSVTITPETALQSNKDGVRHILGLVPALSATTVFSETPADGKLKSGDLIKSIQGKKWPNSEQFIETVQKAGATAIAIEVIRDGKTVKVEVTPVSGRIGVGLATSNAPVIAGTLKDSPFAELELPGGTRIKTVNGKEVSSLNELRTIVTISAKTDVTIEVVEPLAGETEREYTVTVDGEYREQLSELMWASGVEPFFMTLNTPQKADGPLHAVQMGIDKTHVFMVNTYLTLLRLIQGTISPKELRGPVGIVDEGSKIAQRGWAYLMFFLGLISVNLAVLNFLPLPIVDGGHAVLVIVEKIRGKPLSPQLQTAILLAGLALIGTMFLYVTFNDIHRLIS